MLLRKLTIPTLALFSGFLLSSCSKSTSETATLMPYALSYGDSLLYPRDQSSDYLVYPAQQKTGSYSAYPEGIAIDPTTGAINISKSETGMRYLVTYTSPAGETATTPVILSGVNFRDGFYHLSAGDSILSPVYIGNNRVMPGGSLFDDGNGARAGGCAVQTGDGSINLAQTVRNGAFGIIPSNDSRRDFNIVYRVNDISNRSSNKINVRFFYYHTMADVAPDVLQILHDRGEDGLISNPTGLVHNNSFVTERGKNRPPCVVLIAD